MRGDSWVLMLDDTEFTTVLSEERERSDLHDRSSFWLGGLLRMEASERRTHTEHPSLSELSRYVGIQGDWGENTELPRKKGPEICTGPPIVFGWTSSCICVQRDSPPPRPRLNIKWEGSCKLNNLGDHIGLEGFRPTQLEDWLVEHLGYSV